MQGKKNYIHWIIIGALGIFLIIGNQLAQDIFGKVFGAALVLAALSGLFSWWKTKSKAPDSVAQLIGCLVIGGIGLWALTKTEGFITFLNVVLGLIIIGAGTQSLIRGWKHDRSPVTIIGAVLGIILGLMIAFNNAATTWVTIAEGLGLLYTAITGYLGERQQ